MKMIFLILLFAIILTPVDSLALKEQKRNYAGEFRVGLGISLNKNIIKKESRKSLITRPENSYVITVPIQLFSFLRFKTEWSYEYGEIREGYKDYIKWVNSTESRN